MDPWVVVLALVNIALGIGGWALKNAYQDLKERVKDLENGHDAHTGSIHSVKEMLPSTYTSKAELKEKLDVNTC